MTNQTLAHTSMCPMRHQCTAAHEQSDINTHKHVANQTSGYSSMWPIRYQEAAAAEVRCTCGWTSTSGLTVTRSWSARVRVTTMLPSCTMHLNWKNIYKGTASRDAVIVLMRIQELSQICSFWETLWRLCILILWLWKYSGPVYQELQCKKKT